MRVRVCVQYRTLYARALWRALRACMRALAISACHAKALQPASLRLLVRLFGRGKDMLAWVLKGAPRDQGVVRHEACRRVGAVH